MTAGIILGCYGLAWLFTARLLYGRWRGELVSWSSDSWNKHKAREPETAARAMMAALAWPLVLLVGFVRFRPPPTAAEQAAENARLTGRIAELEREAGIRP